MESQDSLPTFEDIEFFRALSEPVRLEILRFLMENGRSDIATVAEAIDRDRSVLSRHLHLMTEAGLLKSEKVARNTYFAFNGPEVLARFEALSKDFSKAMGRGC